MLFLSCAVLTSRQKAGVSNDHRVRALHVAQSVALIIPVLLGVFFLAGNRIDWQVLVIGLAWRGWLLLYTLPSLISALASSDSGHT